MAYFHSPTPFLMVLLSPYPGQEDCGHAGAGLHGWAAGLALHAAFSRSGRPDVRPQPRTFSTVNCLVALLGWGAGNGSIWTLLEVFQACDPFLVCVGLALVQFQRWLNLQAGRQELGWKCSGEHFPEDKSAFLIQAWAATKRDSPTGLLPAPGARAGRCWPEQGAQGMGAQAVGEGEGRAPLGPIMKLHPQIPATGFAPASSAWLGDETAPTEKCHVELCQGHPLLRAVRT